MNDIKFSDILYGIGLGLWLLLGVVIFLNIQNIEVVFTWAATSGIFVIWICGLYFDRLEKEGEK